MERVDLDLNGRLKALNVLVVDDMSDVRAILCRVLRALGVKGRIDEAGDGMEAWEMIQNYGYDLIMCDIRMPRMDGLELKKLLRTNPRFVDLPFLMITGEISEEKMDLALESDRDGYLLKPFPSAVLKQCLLQLLGTSQGNT